MHKWTKIFRWPRRTSEVETPVSTPKDIGSAVSQHHDLVCHLRISFNNEVLLKEINFATKLSISEGFQTLNDGATRDLRQKIDLGTRTLFLRYGRCRLVTPDADEKFYPLRNQSQWLEAVRKNLIAVKFNIHGDHPRLDVRLEYSAIQLEPVDGQRYAQTLRDEINGQMQTNFENHVYVLLNEFIEILAIQSLQRLVQEDKSLFGVVKKDSLFVDRFVHDISQNARKLLAICLVAGLPLLVLKVIRDQGLSDAHLPLRPENCCGKLTAVDFNLLASQQWSFLPYRFTKEEDLSRLEPECIVPMSFDSDVDKVGVGSYSRIYRVSLNQACHDFLTDEDAYFALKHFDACPITAAPCQRELAILNEISRYPNPHIVSHLVAWEQSNSLFVLFPLAQGDLRWFMTKPRPTLDQEFVLWLLRQLRGLADGINHLHNLNPGARSSSSPQAEPQENGIAVLHLDLQPENILVFGRGTVNHDVLRISDLGSGKIKQKWAKGTRTLSGSTQTAETALTYTCPDSENRTISRPYDMWSLGCVFLEFLSWVHLGPEEGVEDFATARLQTKSHQDWHTDAFWQLNYNAGGQLDEHSPVILKPAVTERLSDLEAHWAHCFPVFNRVLSSIRKLLKINPAERINAECLLSELEDVCVQAQQSHLDLNADSS
ncbi:hypothetical protein MMC22_002301 [Lobaria immixta]|nr:hypothetical protein [Lobaria immixta]